MSVDIKRPKDLVKLEWYVSGKGSAWKKEITDKYKKVGSQVVMSACAKALATGRICIVL